MNEMPTTQEHGNNQNKTQKQEIKTIKIID